MQATRESERLARMQEYLDEHFLCSEALAASTNLKGSDRRAFEEAGCAPGAIYRTWSGGGVWSALGARMLHGEAHGEARAWHTPAAVWWLRLASTLSVDAGEARLLLEAHFAQAFEAAIQREPNAAAGFPHLFDAKGDIAPDACRREAAEQWRSWVNGEYGVCLRRFSAEAVATKISARAMVKQLREAHAPRFQIMAEIMRLESVLLPFSPWERPNGTPGWAIDATLSELRCGVEPWAGD